MGALLDALPQGGSAADVKAREVLLLKYAEEAQLYWDWAIVEHSANGHTLRFQVQRDGMKLEGVRLSMSATLAQQIADRIGAVLPTPRINDLVEHYAAVKAPTITRNITASVAGMVAQSQALDAAIGESVGLVGNVGKQWVLTNGLLKPTNGCGAGFPPLQPGQVACNYGFYVPSGGGPAVTFGLHVIQTPGRCHDRAHADYSQVQFLVMAACELDGQQADIRDVMTSSDPAINSLVSHEGPLQTTRQPGVDPSGGGGTQSGPGPEKITVNAGGTGAQIAQAAAWATGATVATFFIQRLLQRWFSKGATA